jgi:hypothetical protein
MFRVGAQFRAGAATASGGNATELELGGDFLPGPSVDAAYVNKNDPACPAGRRGGEMSCTAAFGGASPPVNCHGPFWSNEWPAQTHFCYHPCCD